jgi:hypothetical protein
MRFHSKTPLAEIWNGLGGETEIVVRCDTLLRYLALGARILKLNQSVSGGFETVVEYGDWKYATVTYHPIAYPTRKGSS